MTATKKEAPPHRLKSLDLDDRRHGPGRHDGGQLPVQAVLPVGGFRDGLDLILEDDLLRRVLEGLTGKPAPVGQRRVTAALIVPPVPEQEGEQLLAFATQVVGRCLQSLDQVADFFMDRVRHPHPGQFARPVQPRQRDCVSPVRLHPLARSLRDQRRRHCGASWPRSQTCRQSR